MGQPKLTMPFGQRSVIETVVAAFSVEAINDVVVIANKADRRLCEIAMDAGASVVRIPKTSPDMRSSVQAGLDWLEVKHKPDPIDGWLLAPGDCVGLRPDSVTEIVTAWSASDADVLVPVFDGKRGHPTCFRWSQVEQLRRLDASVGVNWLLKSDTVKVRQFPVTDLGTLSDMDTPDDYARAKRMFVKDEPE